MSPLRATEAFVVLVLVLVPLMAQGEEPAEDPSALFREGYERYEAGDPAGAAERWKQVLTALGSERGGKVRYNLGLAHEKMGDVTEAIAHYRGFLGWVAARPGVLPPELEQRRADAAARVHALESSHIALFFPEQPVPVAVRIDGAPPRPVGFSTYVKPGRHELLIVGPDGRTRRETIDASAGAALTVDTSVPEPPPEGQTTAPPEAQRPEPTEFPLAIVLTGVGLTAASVALPAVLFTKAADAREEAEALGAGHSDYGEAREAFASRYSEYQWSYALPAALGAITLGVAIWGAVEASQGGSETAVVMLPVVGLDGARLSVRGRF